VIILEKKVAILLFKTLYIIIFSEFRLQCNSLGYSAITKNTQKLILQLALQQNFKHLLDFHASRRYIIRVWMHFYELLLKKIAIPLNVVFVWQSPDSNIVLAQIRPTFGTCEIHIPDVGRICPSLFFCLGEHIMNYEKCQC